MISKELIIIGAGPSGLKAGEEAKKSGIDYLILEKGDIAQAWQDIRPDMPMLSPCHPQRDWTSLSNQFPIWKLQVHRPFCFANEFVSYLQAFREYFDLNVKTFCKVTDIKKENGIFLINTATANYTAPILLYTTGFFGNPYIPGIEGFRGNSIVSHSHFYKSEDEFKGQRVVIIGGGNSAAEIAIALSGYSQVYLLTRDKLKFFSDTKNLCHIRGISQSLLLELINMEIIRYTAHAKIMRLNNGNLELEQGKIETNRIICATGYRPLLTLISSLGVAIDASTGYPQVSDSGESVNIKNLFFGGPLAYHKLSNIFIHGFIKTMPETVVEISTRLHQRLLS